MILSYLMSLMHRDAAGLLLSTIAVLNRCLLQLRNMSPVRIGRFHGSGVRGDHHWWENFLLLQLLACLWQDSGLLIAS